MLFTIIIPAFNVENYIQEVVDSVLRQTFTDYEIIIVDDGSDKPCRDLCNQVANSDKRISVIHKENGGVSTSRNEGIKKAKGEYIYFLDGDDRMVEDVLSNASKIILRDRPDIITSSIHRFTDWTKSYYRDIDLGRNNDMSLAELRLKLGTDVYLSHNFYARSFIINDCELFNEGAKVSEDIFWLFTNMDKAGSIVVCEGAFYYHFEAREGSLINAYKDSYYVPTALIYKQMYDRIPKLNYDEFTAKKFVAAIYWNYLSEAVVKCKDSMVVSDCLNIFEDNIYIVKGNHCLIVSRLLIFRKICGDRIFLKVLYYLLKLKNKTRK